MKKRFLILLIVLLLSVPLSRAEKVPATREYFENLDKESRLENIVEDIGNYGIEGSGILYFVWSLEDGSRAKTVFDSTGRIIRIYIVGESSSELIYKREYSDIGSGTESAEDVGITDMEEALLKMHRAIRERLPAGVLPYPGSAEPAVVLFDITGDGCAELYRCVTWGSGMVRTDLVVYDPVQDALYILDGYDFDYLIDHVEEDRIVILMEGPHGYGDPVTKTYGTVKLEEGRLVFVADSEDP